MSTPFETLNKHRLLNPKITIAISAKHDGGVQIDISAPGTIGELLFMREVLNIELAKMMNSFTLPSVPPLPEFSPIASTLAPVPPDSL